MRSLIRELREALDVYEDATAVDGEFVGPDQYRKIIGKCPPSWNFDGGSCKQVRSGPRKFRIGSFEPEVRDKLRAAIKGGGAAAAPSQADAPPAAKPKPARKKLQLPDNPITAEETVPPPNGGPVYDVDPNETGEDGVTLAARVGLCGRCLSPPKKVPRLPNLTTDERDVEARFAEAFEEDPDALVDEYLERLEAGLIGDGPNVFSTDDVKALSPDYNPPGASDDERKDAMGRYNVVVHQTANAIAKRAFLRRLDELAQLPEGDPRRSILVTNGGVASGKGYCLGKVEQTKALAAQVGAVWDSAGEQNGTESPWILEEAKKRGLKTTMVFVDSDPKDTWANPQRGVVERAKKVGRMVDARIFADSYAIGSRNFQALMDEHKDNDQAEFFVLSSRGGSPQRVDAVPEAAMKQDEDVIYQQAMEALHGLKDVPPAVRRGGSIGQRIWSPDADS